MSMLFATKTTAEENVAKKITNAACATVKPMEPAKARPRDARLRVEEFLAAHAA